MESSKNRSKSQIPWNKGKVIGQKPALKLKEIWGIRIRLQIENNIRELALFNMAIDSKLRGCDLVTLRVNDVMHGGNIVKRTIVTQKKTKKPVHFEITEQTRDSLVDLINEKNLTYYDFLFQSRFSKSEHLSTRQYALIVKKWVASIGLDPMEYGTHMMRRTKVALIYQKTKNLRVVQLLLGHSKLESTVRYLGVEVDDALEVSEKMEV
ncbi:MAG: tyrosine-type recombinase/integrase [Gammaproteobacteria bacterium]|nr:tyrosine-type recombinase/integrase [Gammaproteobacteria bacterium]